jgi:hypothetical protein
MAFLSIISVIAVLRLGSNLTRGVYLLGFALATGLAASWLGLSAMSRARKAATSRPRGATAGMVFGIIGSVLSLIVLIFFAAFWPQLGRFSHCLSGASTVSAQQTCLNQLNQQVNHRMAKISPGK